MSVMAFYDWMMLALAGLMLFVSMSSRWNRDTTWRFLVLILAIMGLVRLSQIVNLLEAAA